jgi:chromosome segregation ATPase
MKSVDTLRRFIRNYSVLEGSELWEELDEITSDIEYDISDLEDELKNANSEIATLEKRLEEVE